MTITDAYKWGISRLIRQPDNSDKKREQADGNPFVYSPTPALDSDCILEHILEKSRTYLMAHGDEILSPGQEEKFKKDIRRRRTGLPVAYITGHKEFYGLDFILTPDVLIPKPDTELLVEHAISAVRKIIAEGLQTGHDTIRIADVCTGSGCIAISLLYYLAPDKNVTVTAGDLSRPALEIAKKNAVRLLPTEKQAEIRFVQGDLMEPFDTETGKDHSFNLILSNPPYIPAREVDKLLEDGRNEPRLALDGDAGGQSGNGLAIIRRLVPQAFSRLAPGGLFLVETGEYNAEETAHIMETQGFSNVITFRDLAGQLRLTQGIRPNVN